jgi:hypothetical protein
VCVCMRVANAHTSSVEVGKIRASFVVLCI